MAAHIHGIQHILPTLSIAQSQWLQEHIPENTSKQLILGPTTPMAVYGRAHESYGHARRHLCMTPL
eukprot:2738620-Pyramimonas_sp.AAC.1